MGGYIGATAVGLTTTAADVQGDITSTDTTPELILKNTSEEDIEGGREGKITFKGEQSGGEESTLAQIESAHDGTSDDQKGDLIFKTNDGSDGSSPTERVRIDSNGSILTATLGTDNVHLGEGASASIASGGNNNVAIGKDAGTALTTGDNNVAIGYEALKTEDAHGNNTAIGYQSLKVQDAGANAGNTAIGYQSGVAVTDGHSNTMLGTLAGSVLTTGDENTYVGYGSGSSGTATFTGNTALGFNSLAAGANVGNGTTAIGWSTLKNTNANSNGNNTALGYNAGRGNDTGYDNTFIGSQAGSSNSTGYSNTTLGKGSGSLITTGNANTIVGRFDGNQARADGATLDIRTSSNNIVLSDGAGNPRCYWDSAGTMRNINDQSAGFNAYFKNDHSSAYVLGVETGSSSLVFFYGSGGAGVGTITTNGSTTSYNTSSDYRLKENVVDITGATEKLKQLQPRRFNFIGNTDLGTVDGFIAHEAQTVVPEAVTGTKDQTEAIGDVTDGDGNTVETGVLEPETLKEGHTWAETGTRPVYQGIDHGKLVPLLVATIKELEARIAALEAE